MKLDDDIWTVSTSPVGDKVHVYPSQSALGVDNWKMAIPFLRRWRIWHRSNYRLMYPRTERQVRRSVRWCQVACDEMNSQEQRGRTLNEVAQYAARAEV